jgi:acetyl-CoA acyltransferase
VVGDDPVRMLGAVVPATRSALVRAGLSTSDVDTFEVNEAFAAVPLLWARELGVDHERLNPRGGAIAVGHPLGASGTRLVTTLIHELEDSDKALGLVTMCEAGGMANATVVERI